MRSSCLRGVSSPLSSFCLQIPKFPFGLYSSLTVPRYFPLYLGWFFATLISLRCPTPFFSLLSCQNPVTMVQHSSSHSCIKCSISAVKPFLEKACSPWPLINIYFWWKAGKAFCMYSWYMALPSQMLLWIVRGKEETEEAGIRRKGRNHNRNILPSPKCMKLYLPFHY